MQRVCYTGNQARMDRVRACENFVILHKATRSTSYWQTPISRLQQFTPVPMHITRRQRCAVSASAQVMLSSSSLCKIVARSLQQYVPYIAGQTLLAVSWMVFSIFLTSFFSLIMVLSSLLCAGLLDGSAVNNMNISYLVIGILAGLHQVASIGDKLFVSLAVAQFIVFHSYYLLFFWLCASLFVSVLQHFGSDLSRGFLQFVENFF